MIRPHSAPGTMDARVNMVHAKPNGTSPISAYIAKGASAVGDAGRNKERYADNAISNAKTESVKTPNKTDIRLGLDFSNDKIAAAAMKEDAIEAKVMKGANDLR